MLARWGYTFVQLFSVGVSCGASKGVLAGTVGSWQPWLWLPAGSCFPTGVALQVGVVPPCLSCILFPKRGPPACPKRPAISRETANSQADVLCLENERVCICKCEQVVVLFSVSCLMVSVFSHNTWVSIVSQQVNALSLWLGHYSPSYLGPAQATQGSAHPCSSSPRDLEEALSERVSIMLVMSCDPRVRWDSGQKGRSLRDCWVVKWIPLDRWAHVQLSRTAPSGLWGYQFSSPIPSRTRGTERAPCSASPAQSPGSWLQNILHQQFVLGAAAAPVGKEGSAVSGAEHMPELSTLHSCWEPGLHSEAVPAGAGVL